MQRENNKRSFGEFLITFIKIICAIILVLLIVVLAFQRFSNNEIAIGGFRIFNVATGSMIPKYEVGDVLVTKEIDVNKLKVGDDITYLGKVGTFKDKVVTHQIIQIDETPYGKVFHTKGIANPVEDPTIEGDQIYGKVIYKSIIISIFTKLMNNMTAFYIAIIIPMAILVFFQFKDSLMSRLDSEEDDDDNYEDDEEDNDDDDDDDDDDDE